MLDGAEILVRCYVQERYAYVVFNRRRRIDMNIKKLALIITLVAPIIMSLSTTPAMAQQVFDPAAYASSGMVNGPMYQDSQGNYYATPGPDLTATYGPF